MPDTFLVSFLEQLERNNNKVWFDGHRNEYEKAKKIFEAFVDKLMRDISDIEPAIKGQKAKDNIFRIFRDVRFSADKTPYKTYFSTYISRAGRKAPDAGYYFHLQPGGKSFVAGGLWMPEAALLRAVRQEIDFNYEELQDILMQPSFRKTFPNGIEGEQLKRPPQGYSTDNPALDLLKRKSFTVSTSVPDNRLTAASLGAELVSAFTLLKPLNDFLNRALEKEDG